MFAQEELPGFKKDFVFRIETPKRTYYIVADSQGEMEEWIDILNTIKGKSAEEIADMMAMAMVDPKHAEGTVDTDDILSVGPTNTEDVEGHPSFVIMTGERVYKVGWLFD